MFFPLLLLAHTNCGVRGMYCFRILHVPLAEYCVEAGPLAIRSETTPDY